MKRCTYLFFVVGLTLALTAGQASEPILTGLTDWYVNATNGDDESGIGSKKKPFKSIDALLAVNEVFPGFVGADDTIHLAAGRYDTKSVEIDIPNIKIEGSLGSDGKPASILGDLKITADEVTLINCLFLDAELTLLATEAVTIANNLFSGTTKNSLSVIGSSNNRISNNHFESATESCVVISFDSRSKQSSRDNIFESNYFTNHPEKPTNQVILSNKGSLFKGLSGKKSVSTGNLFLKCAFEETAPGGLEHVIVDKSSWKTVKARGPSLVFKDCYFKKHDRRVPFISFLIIRERSRQSWYWDELLNNTWVTSNDGDLLTGHKKNGYTPSIQFSDDDGDGFVLETEYPFDIEWSGELAEKPENRAPKVINAIEDIAVYEAAEPGIINLFDVFEDDITEDENIEFLVSCDNESLISTRIENGLLTLDYAKSGVGEALIKIIANDNDDENPKSTESSFRVFIVENTYVSEPTPISLYVDSRKGDDSSGDGTLEAPFKTVECAFDAYEDQSKLESADSGGIIHLGEGQYGLDVLEISISGLSLEGTLDKSGEPLTALGETLILADDVKLSNCEFINASLTLSNVENVLISNNLFTGTVDISLYLLGSSNNTIQYNEFSSAIHDCVHIYWDADNEVSSSDNLFLRNYFTHREGNTTRRAIRVFWAPGKNSSISARNRFVECAFEETRLKSLLRVVDDENTWWVVADHQYSMSFEDCYFKLANRAEPFSEFVILKGYPDYTWRWDELMNHEWVSTNGQWAITGDHSGWNHKPRIRFVDKNENGRALERLHNAGLQSTDR